MSEAPFVIKAYPDIFVLGFLLFESEVVDYQFRLKCRLCGNDEISCNGFCTGFVPVSGGIYVSL